MRAIDYAIIAAGEGSRLVSEGIQSPKPLVKLHGKEMIHRLIEIFTANHARSISIIVNEAMPDVQNFLKNLKLDIPLNLVIKSTPSSMHSFHELRHLLSADKFCLTTVDTIFKEDEFSSFIREFIADDEHDGIMAVTDYIDDEKPLYVDVNCTSMLIRNFVDESETCIYISGGIYALNKKAIKILEKSVENGLSRMRNFQRQLIADGLKLKAYPFSKILDIDHAEDIIKAEAFLEPDKMK